MVQSNQLSASERTKLITLLPRLRRFATVLAGERSGADQLLREACKKMLRHSGGYQRGTAFDIWAFRGLHADWIAGLRTHARPLSQAQGDTDAFVIPEIESIDDAHLADTVDILAKLPAQQRSVVLLLHGEGLSYEEAAEVLDTDVETVVARLSRALATFVERAGWLESAKPKTAQIQRLNRINRQAG